MEEKFSFTVPNKFDKVKSPETTPLLKPLDEMSLYPIFGQPFISGSTVLLIFNPQWQRQLEHDQETGDHID